MFNRTFQFSTVNNSTVVPERSTIIVIAMLAVSVWIITINALVFTCLVISRKTLKNFVNIQMLSFSLTDMFVGVCAIPVTLTYQITAAFPSFEVCAGIFYCYCLSQSANLFHGCAICLHRIVIIKRCAGRKEANPKSMLKTLLFQISFIWIVSVLLVAVPFGLFGRFGDIIGECSLNSLFEDNYIYFIAFMNLTFFIPQIAMDVVYVYMFWFLSVTWRDINKRQYHCGLHTVREEEQSKTSAIQSFLDTNSNDNTADTVAPDFNICKDSFNSVNTSNKIDRHTSKRAKGSSFQSLNMTFPGKDRNASLKVFLCTYEESTSGFDSRNSSVDDTSYDIKDNDNVIKRGHSYRTREKVLNYSQRQNALHDTVVRSTMELNKKPFFRLNRKATKHRNGKQLGFKGQKEVLITIGMILLAVNIFMTPLNMLVLIEIIIDGFLTREIKGVLMSLSMMNSALNPIIYILRIKPFRKAFARNWNSFILKFSSSKWMVCFHSPFDWN